MLLQVHMMHSLHACCTWATIPDKPKTCFQCTYAGGHTEMVTLTLEAYEQVAAALLGMKREPQGFTVCVSNVCARVPILNPKKTLII
jgi:hypothetical protein